MKKIIFPLVYFVCLAVSLGVMVGHANALSNNDSIDLYNGVLSVAKTPSAQYPITYGDSWHVVFTNNTDCTVTLSDKVDTQQLTPGQVAISYDYSNVTTQLTINISSTANTGSCGSTPQYASETVYPGTASALSCVAHSTYGLVSGQYANFVPSGGYFSQGSSIYNINNSSNSGSINSALPTNGNAQTYYLYNSTPGAQGIQVSSVSCPAYVAPSSGGTSTNAAAPKSPATKATTASATNSVTTKTNTPSKTSTTTPNPVPLYAKPVNNKYKRSGLGNIGLVLIIIFSLLFLFTLVSMWLVFTKAGRPGWAVIVPFYSSWVLYEIGGKPGWWTLIGLIPVIGLAAIVMLVIAEIEIAKRFGKSALFGFFGLFLFWFVGWPILAFSKAKYNDATLKVSG